MIRNYNVEDAKEFGLNAAVLLWNIAYWQVKNAANDSNYHDGHHWTYNSTNALSLQFPEFTQKQIKTALKKLEDVGVIKSGNYNKNKFDRTKWYTIVNEAILQRHHINWTQVATPLDPEVQPIPDNIPNKEKDIYININTQKNGEANIPFEQVWDAYDRKEGRHIAETKWLKLSDEERSLVAECIPKYVADNPNKKYRKHFATFLNQKTWKDYESSNKAIEQRDKTISILLDKLQSGEFNRRDCGEYIRQEGHSIDDELYIKRKLIELGCFKEDA